MTPRTLFTILIKIVGVSLLIDALSVIPQFLSTAIIIGNSFSTDNSIAMLIAIVVVLFVMGLYLIVMRICLFRTGFIITKLSLDKHFTEEKFEINIATSTILPIAIIVIGGIIIVDALPQFCRQIFSYVQQRRAEGQGFENPSLGWIIFYGVKLLVGYFLISNNKKLTRWIEDKTK